MLLFSLFLACGPKKQSMTTAGPVIEPEVSYNDSELANPEDEVKKESKITVIEKIKVCFQFKKNLIEVIINLPINKKVNFSPPIKKNNNLCNLL